MWKEFVSKLRLDDWQPEIISFAETSDGEVLDGLIRDKNGGAFLIIEGGILDLLDDSIADWNRRDSFLDRYSKQCTALNVASTQCHRQSMIETAEANSDNTEKIDQREHHDQEAPVYDKNLSDTPFAISSDDVLMNYWIDRVEKSTTVVDLGCGTGRRSIQVLQKSNCDLIGIEISYEMVLRARCKCRMHGLLKRVNFCVGDAETNSFRNEIADIVTVTGVLHHVEEPQRVLTTVYQLLKDDGFLLSIENNKSGFRFLFDWLQELIPAWNEKAGKHHVISCDDITRWLRQSGDFYLERFRYHVFLPPHVFNFIGTNKACKLMRWSDKLGNLLIQKHAGLIITEARKAGLTPRNV